MFMMLSFFKSLNLFGFKVVQEKEAQEEESSSEANETRTLALPMVAPRPLIPFGKVKGVMDLPRDVLIYIFVRLPKKSIYRFRFVNKEWLEILTDHEFLELKQKHDREVNVKYSVMIHNHYDITIVDYNTTWSGCNVSRQLKYPFGPYKKGIDFFGCCKGIVLFRHVDRNLRNTLVLWNPTTNKYKELADYPQFESTGVDMECVEFGIGYDFQVEDFKVVSVGSVKNKGRCEVQIYRFKSNIWERVKDIYVEDLSHRLIPDMARMPVNGALHWIAMDDRGFEVLLCFDFEKDEFEEVPLPDWFHDNCRTSLCVLRESLCLFNYFKISTAEAWELKGKGKRKSWSKLFTIDLQDHFGIVRSLMPLQYLESGEVLLSIDEDGHSRIVLYDPQYRTTTTLHEYLEVCSCCSFSSVCTSIFLKSQVSHNIGPSLMQESDLLRL